MLSKLCCGLIGISALLLATAQLDCTPQDAKTPKDLGGAAIKVADDVCTEVQDAGTPPDWVTLLCTAVDTADKIRVLLPRPEWSAIRARRSKVDAGPGK